MSGMQRVTDERGKQTIVECPGCQRPVALWLNELEPEESRAYRERIGVVFATASVVEPRDRRTAMERDAQAEARAMILPWCCCVSCGYDGHYTIGSADVSSDFRSAAVAAAKGRRSSRD